MPMVERQCTVMGELGGLNDRLLNKASYEQRKDEASQKMASKGARGSVVSRTAGEGRQGEEDRGI
jgi:hypothetical protein